MIKVVGVRFKRAGKIYYFDPDGLSISANSFVIVETARGIEYGEVVIGEKEITEEEVVQPLKKVIRVATEEDIKKAKENDEKTKEVFSICEQKIKEHKLDMKLVDAEYTFDNNKVLFYFTADGRIDFRELVKDLAAIFKTRIELRQIGVRDEVKILGGIGMCGLSLCCNTFLGEFQPVSIKMAKEQGLSLNPTKISGVCGRLMCCLKYEQDAYEDAMKRMPKVGAIVETADGEATVIYINLLKETVKVKLNKEDEAELRVYKAKDVKIIKDSDIQENNNSQEDLNKLKELED